MTKLSKCDNQYQNLTNGVMRPLSTPPTKGYEEQLAKLNSDDPDLFKSRFKE